MLHFIKLLVKSYNSFLIDIDEKAINLAKKNRKLRNKVFNLDFKEIGNKLGKFDIAVLRVIFMSKIQI